DWAVLARWLRGPHAGADAGLPVDEAEPHQLFDRLAHGEAARAELLAQCELGRQQIAHRIAPALDLVDERLRELAIARLRCEQIHKQILQSGGHAAYAAAPAA